MNFFKLLGLLNALTGQVAQALADNELTIKEITDLINTVMKQTLGYGLDQIAVQIKEENGKKEIKIVLKEDK